MVDERKKRSTAPAMWHYIVGALWAITMALAASWGNRIDARLASIDATINKAAMFQGSVTAKISGLEVRVERLEQHHP